MTSRADPGLDRSIQLPMMGCVPPCSQQPAGGRPVQGRTAVGNAFVETWQQPQPLLFSPSELNTGCLHCCPRDGDHQDGSWKPWDRLWGMGLGRLVGIGC